MTGIGKPCRGCFVEKTLDAFPRNRNRADGRDGICRACRALRARKRSNPQQGSAARPSRPEIRERQADAVLALAIAAAYGAPVGVVAAFLRALRGPR